MIAKTVVKDQCVLASFIWYDGKFIHKIHRWGRLFCATLDNTCICLRTASTMETQGLWNIISVKCTLHTLFILQHHILDFKLCHETCKATNSLLQSSVEMFHKQGSSILNMNIEGFRNKYVNLQIRTPNMYKQSPHSLVNLLQDASCYCLSNAL